jgi:hypothetical protein
MTDNHRVANAWGTGIDNFAAEVTRAVYPLVLRRGLKNSWLKVELGLWRALAETVKSWLRSRPPAPSPQELQAWREGLLVELTESAFHIALKNGIRGSLLELEVCLYQAVRLVTQRHSGFSKLKVRHS